MIAETHKLFFSFTSFPHLALSMTSRRKTSCLLACLVLQLVHMLLIRVLTTLADWHDLVGWL